MLDFRKERARPGEHQTLKNQVINDLEGEWSGEVRLAIRREDEEKTFSVRTVPARDKGWGREALEVAIDLPIEEVEYTLKAEIITPGTPIRSLRGVRVTSSGH